MRARALEAIGVVFAYTAVAVFATWPLAKDPLGGFYGFGNDNWGGIGFLGWLHDAYVGSESGSAIDELQAPFGLSIPTYAIQPLDRLAALLFGGFDQGLGAYNAQIFASFVLSGCTMYLLARYVTGNRLAALLAGFAYTFSPFHLAFGMQYNALAGIQWIPLYLLALLVVLRTGRLLHAALAGGAFALVVAGSYYYAWFVAWFTVLLLASLALYALARRRDEIEWRRAVVLTASRGALAAVVAVAILAPLLLTSARAAQDAERSTLEHPISEAVRYSARPWMLFVPPQDNPIVGERVRDWVMVRLHGAPIYEQSLYVGFTLMALIAIALLPRWRGRAGDRLSRPFLVAGALVAGTIMMGPYIPLDPDYWKLWATPEATRHLPSVGWLMFELGPVFRFFSRAFILFSACLVVLGAIGFSRLDVRLGTTLLRRAALAAVVFTLVALEYTNAPPHVWTSDRSPPWVEAVERLPEAATIAHYPAATANSPRSLYYIFWQTKHRRSMTQPPADPPAIALAEATRSLRDPASIRRLRRAGVDYVVVHTDLPPQTRPPYQPALPPDALPPDAGAANPLLAVAARTPDAVIYRLLSTPRRVAPAVDVSAGRGIGGPEPEPGGAARWVDAPEGELELFVSGPPRPLELRLAASSFSVPRRVDVAVDGRTVGSFDASPERYAPVAVSLGRVAPGFHRIVLTTTPGPQSIFETTGTPDMRTVSIRIAEPIEVVEQGRP